MRQVQEVLDQLTPMENDMQLSDYQEQIAERAAQTGATISLTYTLASDAYVLTVNATPTTYSTLDLNKSGNPIALFDRRIAQLLNEL